MWEYSQKGGKEQNSEVIAPKTFKPRNLALLDEIKLREVN